MVIVMNELVSYRPRKARPESQKGAVRAKRRGQSARTAAPSLPQGQGTSECSRRINDHSHLRLRSRTTRTWLVFLSSDRHLRLRFPRAPTAPRPAPRC